MILGEIKKMDENIKSAVDWDVDNMNKIIRVINEVDLPEGDYMDKDKLIMMVEDGSVTDDDLMEALILTTNALLEIRSLLY